MKILICSCDSGCWISRCQVLWEQSLLWQCLIINRDQLILLFANKSSPIRCFSQLSLFDSCYQSFIPPKSQLQQMIWKTEWQTWWDFVGMKLLFVKFPFGTEMRMSQQNHEGGWSGFGMATIGIYPNDFDLHPNKIPTGGVVQNCLPGTRFTRITSF